MEQKNALTGQYSAVQGTFWMGYCVCISFAAVYLQGLGYTNAQLGVVMAVGNLLGAVLGPELPLKPLLASVGLLIIGINAWKLWTALA